MGVACARQDATARSIEGKMERRPATVCSALAEWLDDLTFSRSSSTIATYRSLLRFDDIALDELDRAWCRQWMMSQVRRRKPAGAHTACSALKAFCAYLVERGWLLTNPTDGAKGVPVPEPPAKALSALQIDALWAAAGELDGVGQCVETDLVRCRKTIDRAFPGSDEGYFIARADLSLASPTSRVSIDETYGRDAQRLPPLSISQPSEPAIGAAQLEVGITTGVEERCASHRPESITHRLLLSLLSAGLRRSELAGLRWQDIDLERRTMLIFGKGRKYRMCLLPKVAVELLSTVNRWAGQPTPIKPVSGSVLNMNDDQVYTTFKRIARHAGIGWAHPHLCRHTFATVYLRKGGSPLHLQTLGGWAKDTMVQRYARGAMAEAALDEARRLED